MRLSDLARHHKICIAHRIQCQIHLHVIGHLSLHCEHGVYVNLCECVSHQETHPYGMRKLYSLVFYQKKHPYGMHRIVCFQKGLFVIILSWHEPTWFVLFLNYEILPDKGIHAYTYNRYSPNRYCVFKLLSYFYLLRSLS
jgi:hypothetical protein